jgi:type IV pilus assembly protein PilM
MGIFSSSSNSYLGLDIGTSSFKLVELSKPNNKKKDIQLSTYGYSESLKNNSRNTWRKDVQKSASIVNKLYKKSGATSEDVVASLPTYSVFSSIINVSGRSSKNLEEAVNREAKKVIPMSLEEMILDWKILERNKKENNIRVFLTASPKKLVKSYIELFRQLQLNLVSLETESFSLIRSLVGQDNGSYMIAGMGKTNTDISIVTDGIPVLNRSIDVGGGAITEAISKNLNINKERAEQFKCDMGITSLDSNKQDVIPKTIIKSVNPIIDEMKYMLNLFEQKNEKNVEKIILTGGTSLLVNFSNYLSKTLDMNVVIGDPWARISYPEELKPALTEVGPKMAPAIGAAMRQLI